MRSSSFNTRNKNLVIEQDDKILREKGKIEEIIIKYRKKWTDDGFNGLDSSIIPKLEEILRKILTLPLINDSRDVIDNYTVVDKLLIDLESFIRQKNETLAELQMLAKMQIKRNIFVFRGYSEDADKPDNRNELLQFLKSIKKDSNMQANKPNFNLRDKKFIKAIGYADQLIRDTRGILSDNLILPEELKGLEEAIQRNNAEKERAQEELRGILESKEKKELGKQLTDQKESLHEQLNQQKALEDQCSKRLSKLQEECNRIYDLPAIDFEDAGELITEDRPWFVYGWFGQYLNIRTVKEYDFPLENSRIPIASIELSCIMHEDNNVRTIQVKSKLNESTQNKLLKQDSNLNTVSIMDNVDQVIDAGKETGEFKIVKDKVDLSNGKFSCVYTSFPGMHGYASIRVFVLPRNLPKYKDVLSEKRRFIDFDGKKLENIKAVKNRIQNDINYFDSVEVGDKSEIENKIKRIKELLYRLNYIKVDFIQEYINIPNVEWLGKADNFNKLRQLLNCSSSQILKLSIVLKKGSGILEHPKIFRHFILGDFDRYSPVLNLPDDAVRGIINELPKGDFLQKLYDFYAKTGIPVASLCEILAWDYKGLSEVRIVEQQNELDRRKKETY